MILGIFDLQVILILPIKFRVSWPFYSEKFKTDFQKGDCGGHIGFWIRTNLAIFDLQVTQILPVKFEVNWLFGSGDEVQNNFLR